MKELPFSGKHTVCKRSSISTLRQSAIFGGAAPILKRIKYFNVSSCHNHLLAKPNIYAKFEQNW